MKKPYTALQIQNSTFPVKVIYASNRTENELRGMIATLVGWFVPIRYVARRYGLYAATRRRHTTKLCVYMYDVMANLIQIQTIPLRLRIIL